jgi:hypothetical protein
MEITCRHLQGSMVPAMSRTHAISHAFSYFGLHFALTVLAKGHIQCFLDGATDAV